MARDKPYVVTAVGGTSYTYDNNGSMTARGPHNLTWNIENQLSSYNDGSTTTTFVYDGNGQRGKKTVGGTTTLYVNKYYEKTGDTITTSYYLGGRLAAQREGTTLRYIHQDHLTGTALTTNTNGSQVGTTMTYYPYGSTRSGSVPTDKKFTGQRLDGTGLYYYGARYYDPVIGRFISADSIVQSFANPQTLNRYSYVLNNPLRYVDPTGRTVQGFEDIKDLEAAIALGVFSGSDLMSAEAFVAFNSSNPVEGLKLLKSEENYTNFVSFSNKDNVFAYLQGAFGNPGALVGSGYVTIGGWAAQKGNQLEVKVTIVSSYSSFTGWPSSTIKYSVYADTVSGKDKIDLKTSLALVNPNTRSVEGLNTFDNVPATSEATLSVNSSALFVLPPPDQLPLGPTRPETWQFNLRTGRLL